MRIFLAFIGYGTILYFVLNMQTLVDHRNSRRHQAYRAGENIYTFSTRLKWIPVIIPGYFGSIAARFLINIRYFQP